LGARTGVPEAELDQAINRALAAAGRCPAEVAVLATLDRRAAESPVQTLAARHGWTLLSYPAADLTAVEVPRPSELVRAKAGTPSVAEAAALRGAGPGGTLVAEKRVFPRVTVAIADRVPAYPKRS
jgi:cobalamin biosynthesis protein CbiG